MCDESSFTTFQKAIAHLLLWVMLFAPAIALADTAPRIPAANVQQYQQQYQAALANGDIKTTGEAAGELGNAIGEQAGVNAPEASQNADGSFNLGTTTDQYGQSQTTKMSVSQMFPGDQQQDAFPGGKTVDIDHLKGETDSSLSTESVSYKQALYNDAMQSNPSTNAGKAYKILLNDAKNGKPDLRNDPVFNTTRTELSQADSVTQNFSSCSLQQQVQQSTQKVRIHDYKTCQKFTNKTGACTVDHIYGQSPVVEWAGGETSINSCGPGCTMMSVGKVGDNYYQGNCTIFEQKTIVKVDQPDKITSAVLTEAKWDDYIQIYLVDQDTGAKHEIYNGPNSNFPPETGGACDLKTSWLTHPNVDLTSIFKGVKAGDTLEFLVRVSVGGGGEGYGQIEIHYPESSVLTDKWVAGTGASFDDCMKRVTAATDGAATATVTCTDDPGTDCVDTAGGQVCSSELGPTPFDSATQKLGEPSISKMCKEVTVQANYTYYKGQTCYIDRNGNQQCVTVPDSAGSSGQDFTDCSQLSSNPSCSFVSSQCVEGATGPSGNCYVETQKWDCGEYVNAPKYSSQTDVSCDGQFLCQGDSCGNIQNTQSNSFTKAATLLQAADFMALDGSCEKKYDTTGKICTVFGGQAYQCKVVGLTSMGVNAVNCCNQPVHISDVGSFIKATADVGAMNSFFTNINPNLPFAQAKGAYQYLKDPVVHTFSEVTQPFTNSIQTVTGPVKDAIQNDITKPVGDFLTSLKESISKKMSQFFAKEGLNGAGSTAAGGGATGASNLAGQQAAQQGGSQVASAIGTAGNVLGTIMGAYTAVMLAYLAIQIIYKCTNDEIELDVKRQLKSCEEIGAYCKTKVLGQCTELEYSYCCFNSPLSRIVNTQAKPQLGLSMGSAESPDCSGIPVSDLDKIDWSKIDLSEWTGLLEQQGALKSDLSWNGLTGTGNPAAIDPQTYGTRTDTIQRTKDRMSTGSVDDTRIIQAQKYHFDAQ